MSFAPLLFQVGRCEEALGSLDRLLKKLSSPRYRVFRAILLSDLGRLDEAETELDQTFNLWPRDYRVWFNRFYYLLYNGKPQEALALVDDTANRPVGIPAWNFDLVRSQAEAVMSASQAKLQASLQALMDVARTAGGHAENAAIFAAFINDLESAFKILVGLYTNRGFAVADVRYSAEQALYQAQERNTHVLFRRQLQSVRREPRFRALTQEIGLEDYWQRTGSRDRVLI
jgi:tetratricopeptide (TPR) repeat protein